MHQRIVPTMEPEGVKRTEPRAQNRDHDLADACWVLLHGDEHNSIEETIEALVRSTDLTRQQAVAACFESRHHGSTRIAKRARADADRLVERMIEAGIVASIRPIA